jgi:hypothetical protein
MIRYLLAVLVLIGLRLAAADPDRPLYQRTAEHYPAPILQAVRAREFKCLIDPARLPREPEAALREIWARIQAAADKAGFTVSENSAKQSRKAAKMDVSIKEYLDTPGQDLWKRGWLIRVSAKTKHGAERRSITVKAIHGDAVRTLATPLRVVGADAKTDAEGNIGLGPDALAEYVEKGATWTVSAAQLEAPTLADVAKYMPELLQLGLPADTALVPTVAHALHFKPGHLRLPGGGAPLPFSVEGWSRSEGGELFLCDVSFRSTGVDYYQNDPVQAAAERFLTRVLLGELQDLAPAQAGRWGGSKVRALMNRPLSR